MKQSTTNPRQELKERLRFETLLTGISARFVKIPSDQIDDANRKVTLLGPDGDEFTVKVGPEAVNFDQVRVGDLVNASVTEELIVYLNKESVPAFDGGSLKALGFMEIDKGAPAPSRRCLPMRLPNRQQPDKFY